MNFSINIDKLNEQIAKINRSRGGMNGLMNSLKSMGYRQPTTYEKYGFGLRDMLWNVAGLTMMFGLGFGMLSLGHTKTKPITIEKLKTRVDRHVSFLYKFFNIRVTDPQLAQIQMKYKFMFDKWFKMYHTTLYHDADEILEMWRKIEPTIKLLCRDLDAIAPKEMKEKVKEQVKQNKELNFSFLDLFKGKKKIDEEFEDGEKPTPQDECKWLAEDIQSVIYEKFPAVKQDNILLTMNRDEVEQVAKIYGNYYQKLLKNVPNMWKEHRKWFEGTQPIQQHAEQLGVDPKNIKLSKLTVLSITLVNDREIGIEITCATVDRKDNVVEFKTMYNANGKVLMRAINGQIIPR